MKRLWSVGVLLLSLSFMACGSSDKGELDCTTDLCDDGDPCTLNCLQGGGCVYPLGNVGMACQTDLCMEGATCDINGACSGGTAIDLEANPCQICGCDPESGLDCDGDSVSSEAPTMTNYFIN